MSGPRIIDGRNLLPPEPLELTIDALESLSDGEYLTLLLYCQPHPLYEILRRDGYLWEENLQADGTREIRIRKATAGR
ncbi:MAG: DUF2249 domain-containing protein [Rhodocyclaceae bacterium]|nr:DUF2249 domain-containing protein [Rhodocyclaceae bacterium]